MEVIYLTYANDERYPLSSLREEDDNVNELLIERKRAGHFQLERDSYVTREKIAKYLVAYRDNLIFFGFSGHAGRDVLIAGPMSARAEGIAHLLGQCPNLKVVLLNGCSTVDQVQGLLEQGVPAVIATHAPVNDNLAKDFAVALFKSLIMPGMTLNQAFLDAAAQILVRAPKEFHSQRGIQLEKEATDLWGLFWQDEKVLEWKLPYLDPLTELERKGLEDKLELYTKKLNFFKLERGKTTGADAQEKIRKRSTGFPKVSTVFFTRRMPSPRYGEISCDRDDELAKLKTHFEQNKNHSFQHFFINGQYEDKADSLVERFIIDVLVAAKYDVDYTSEISNPRYGPILTLQQLPQSIDLAQSKRAMQSYFADRFFHGAPLPSALPETIEDLFPSSRPVLQKDYLVSVFTISPEQRRDFLPDFLHWIVHDFCRGRHPKLKFLFFYNLFEKPASSGFLTRFWPKPKRDIHYFLERLRQTTPCCYYLPSLSWVPATALETWFTQYTTHTLVFQEYIRQAKKKHASHYDPVRDAFRMHVVEFLLGEIIMREEEINPPI